MIFLGLSLWKISFSFNRLLNGLDRRFTQSSPEFFVCLFVFNGPPLSKHPLWALYPIVKINSADLGNIWYIRLVLTGVLEK